MNLILNTCRNIFPHGLKRSFLHLKASGAFSFMIVEGLLAKKEELWLLVPFGGERLPALRNLLW